MEGEKQFLIAHLSDLHLNAGNNLRQNKRSFFHYLSRSNEAFKNIIKSQPIKNANLIIITGDVTDRGDIESWEFFWKEIQAAGLIEKIIIVPGNHDACCMGARSPFKKNLYRQHDMEKLSNGLKIGNHCSKFPWVRQYDKRVVIFGLNSTNLGNFSFLSNAIGRITQNQLLSLAEQLYNHKNVPVKIVVLHHSLSERTNVKKKGRKLMNRLMLMGRRLPNRQQRVLMLLCLSHGVQIIAHGHVHRAEDRVVDGIRIIGAPPTTRPLSQIGTGNTYHFYTYTIRGQNSAVHAKLEKIQF